jgi:hypothetical protein
MMLLAAYVDQVMNTDGLTPWTMVETLMTHAPPYVADYMVGKFSQLDFVSLFAMELAHYPMPMVQATWLRCQGCIMC